MARARPDRASWANGAGSRPGVRRVCLALIALLYVASIPWYRAPGQPLRLWLGLPDWVAVALLCYVGVAILNAFAWLATEVPDALESPPETSDGPETPE